MKLSNTQTGLTGEFYALAQLTARGLTATLTLGNTKGVDILVRNDNGKLFQVEVKTTTRTKPGREKLFNDGKPCYNWILGKSSEERKDENLVYVFIMMERPEDLPRFFIAPGPEVSHYVSWQHKFWLDGDTKRNDSGMRKFRIPVDEADKYENNWDIFISKR